MTANLPGNSNISSMFANKGTGMYFDPWEEINSSLFFAINDFGYLRLYHASAMLLGTDLDDLLI